MKRKYLFGVAISLLVLVVNQVFIQYWLSRMKYDAKSINIAGRQRMLSQRIALELYKIKDGIGNESLVKQSITEWHKAHKALLFGDDSYGLKPIEHTLSRVKLLSLTSSIEFTEKLLQESKIDAIDMHRLTKNQAEFLSNMDEVVNLLEEEADEKLYLIILIEIVLLIVAITVLSLEVRYIYMPITSRLSNLLKKVRNSEIRLQALYNSSTEAISYVDKDLKIQFNNLAFKKLIEALFEKEVKNGESILDYTLPDYKDVALERYSSVLQGAIIEETVQYKDIWIESQVYPVKYEDKVVGIAMYARDITSRKNLENQLELIASNFPNGSVTLLDKDKNIVYTNGSGYKELGIDPLQWNGKNLRELLTKDVLEEVDKVWDLVMKGENAEYQVQLGNQYYLSRLKPIISYQEVERIVLTSIEITDLIAYQKQIKERDEKLLRISWSQSHEVRGPLSSILGLISILEDFEYQDSDQKKFIGYLKSSAENLDKAIRKIIKATNLE